MCLENEEIIIHSLITCPVTARCWNIVLEGRDYGEFSSFASWFSYVLNKSNQNKKAEIVSLCWSIWKARNEIVWNKKRVSVNKIVAMAKQYLLQWKTVQGMSTTAILQPTAEEDGACV